MKIRISEDQHDFSIRIPSALILNGITARIACNAAGKNAPEAAEKLTPDALQTVFAELNRIRKKYGAWVLVEVEGADGKRVEITL